MKHPRPITNTEIRKGVKMNILKWVLIFFAVSIVSALLGFTNIAAATAGIARILFFIFIVIFIILLLTALTRKQK